MTIKYTDDKISGWCGKKDAELAFDISSSLEKKRSFKRHSRIPGKPTLKPKTYSVYLKDKKKYQTTPSI